MALPKQMNRWIPFHSALRRAWNLFRPLPTLALQGYDGELKPSEFGDTVDRENLLEQIGLKHQPTKRLHDYLKWYHFHFRDIRLAVRTLLEIGVDSGRSLKMWEEYFPNARIHGIDIRPECAQFAGGRRHVHIGNAADARFLESILTQEPIGFDIVIDDGSHWMEHQLMCFNSLFPRLTSHGIYVVEDTGACVGDFGSRVIQRLSGLVSHINYWPRSMPSPWPPPDAARQQDWLSRFPTEGHWADRNIAGISFYRWVVFVHRGRNPDDNPLFRGSI